MKIAAASLLVLLIAVTSQANQPVIVEDDTLPCLIPLFISCDLQEQFMTPAIDARTLLWMETPVSREGARMLAESRRQWNVAQVPLVLDSATAMQYEARPAVSGPIGAMLNEPVLTTRGHVGVGCRQIN